MEEAPWDWQGGDHTISPLLATLLTLTPVGPTQGRMLLAPITAKSPLQRWEGGFVCTPLQQALYNTKQNLFPLAIQKPTGPGVLTSVR